MKVGYSLAQFGKTTAAKYLHKQGFRIIEMHFKKNYTEIDIIATKDSVLVFFEVRTRISEDKFFQEITKERLEAIAKAGKVYFHLHAHLPKKMRIDAIGITMDTYRNVLDIEHVENIKEI